MNESSQMYVKCMNESCQTYEQVMSNIWTSRVTYNGHASNACCRAWVRSRTWINYVTLSNSFRRCTLTYIYIKSHCIYICHTHVTAMSAALIVVHDSCLTYECVISHSLIHANDACSYIYVYITLRCIDICKYGVASVCRIDKIVGLFCKRAL